MIEAIRRKVPDLEFRVDTFVWYLQLSTLDDLDYLRRLVTRALWRIFDLLNDIVAF